MLAVVLALAAWDAWRGDLPAGELPAPPGVDASPARGGARPDEARTRPERDPFHFGQPDRVSPTGGGPEHPEATAPPAATPEPPAPVRLVGFIRQGGELRAALAVLGRVALVAEGETVEGYEVVAVEQDVGVEVRFPDGTERELRLPPR